MLLFHNLYKAPHVRKAGELKMESPTRRLIAEYREQQARGLEGELTPERIIELEEKRILVSARVAANAYMLAERYKEGRTDRDIDAALKQFEDAKTYFDKASDRAKDLGSIMTEFGDPSKGQYFSDLSVLFDRFAVAAGERRPLVGEHAYGKRLGYDVVDQLFPPFAQKK